MSHFHSLRSLALEVVVPAILFAFFSNFIVGSDAVVTRVDAFAPLYDAVPIGTTVEKQVLHIDAVTRRASEARQEILFTGSSAVINGLDVDQLRAELPERLKGVIPLNFGLTGLLAYELPLLKQFIVRRNVRTVVYLYNTFSFGDHVHPHAIAVRWSTAEMLRIDRPDWFSLTTWHRYARGSLNEAFDALRYSRIITAVLRRAMTGTARPTPYSYDVDPERDGLSPVRARVHKPPADPTHWYRASYAESQASEDTLGYRGLKRFLDLAAENGIEVLLWPVPEPAFAEYEPWKQGTINDLVDQKVAAIARERGLSWLPRSEIAAIEANDTLFRDHVHLNREGRRLYTSWLAARLGVEVR